MWMNSGTIVGTYNLNTTGPIQINERQQHTTGHRQINNAASRQNKHEPQIRCREHGGQIYEHSLSIVIFFVL